MTTATRHARTPATPATDWRRRPNTATRSWEDRSACYNRPESWWDGDNNADTARARQVCVSCPVLAECLAQVMQREASLTWSRWGVRAGLTGPERVQLFLDERADGPYDAEEARLLALEAAAYGCMVDEVAEDVEEPSTVRLAKRLAGESVPRRKPPTVTELRGGSARERAFDRAQDIMRWRQEEGMSGTAIAKMLGMGREPVMEVIRAYSELAQSGDTEDAPEGMVDGPVIAAYLDGEDVRVTQEQRLRAIAEGVRRGMSYPQIDKVRGLATGTTVQFVSRERRKYEAKGWEFPVKPIPRTLFTDEQVVEMRELYAKGNVTDLDIAVKYGAPRNAVSHALNGKNYKHVGGPIRTQRRAASVHASRVQFCGHTAATDPSTAVLAS